MEHLQDNSPYIRNKLSFHDTPVVCGKSFEDGGKVQWLCKICAQIVSLEARVYPQSR